MNVQIVQALPSDGAKVGEILSQWIDDTPWMPRIHTPEQDIGHGKWLVKVCTVTVAKTSNGVVGFLALQGDEIQALYLAPAERGQGIGTGLLNHAKAQATGLGLWSFQKNTGALRFYARHGFVEHQRSDGAGNDEKLPDVRLIWEAGKK